MKALQIDDTLAEAHTSLAGVMQAYEWKWDQAEQEFKRAIELNPGYATAHQWYALTLSLLGRHVLYGCLGGVCFAVVGYLGPVMKTWMGSPPFVDRVPDWVLDLLLGGRYVFAHLLNTQVTVVIFISVFVLLLLLQILFRRRWLAVVVLYLAFVVLMMGGSTAFAPSITWVAGALTNLIILFTLVRFGLLPYIILWTAHQVVLLFFPATFDFSGWYAGIGLVGPLVVLGIAGYGFWVSLAGRPLFKDDLQKA